MRKSFLLYLMMLLCPLSALAQTEGYDPSNPPNPSVPEESYQLTVATSPTGLGHVNTTGGKYKEGESIYLYADTDESLIFHYWMDDAGKTLSTSTSFYYTMPARNVQLTAVYSYSPKNPDNPDVPVLSYKLTLKSKPTGAGSFSPNNTVKLKEGSTASLNAYTNNSHFKFLRWEDEQGKLVSTASSFFYTMPGVNTTLYGVFDYDPSNPSNPGKNGWDSFSGQVLVDDFTPGSLSSAILEAIGKADPSEVREIIVSGKVNNNDFSIANNFSSCKSLDLSRTTGATNVPWYCFYGNTALRRILLPSSIDEIGSYAFYDCSSLTELTVYAITPPTLGTYAFNGVPEGLVVYVPSSSVALYEAAEGWSNYIIMPIKGEAYSLELNLPEECKDGRYKNMALELVNIKSGQRYKYVVTDRLNYIFSNLMKNTTYNAYLKNLSDVVLAELDSIEIVDADVSVTFKKMLTLQNLSLSVLAPDGTDITSQVTVRWYDNSGNLLVQGNILEGQVEGSDVGYSVSLPQALAMKYLIPTEGVYTVNEEDNHLTCRLEAIPSMTLQGKVVDMASSEAMMGTMVTVTQQLNDLYSKTFTTTTDEYGAYSIEVFAAPTTVSFSSDDYISQSIELGDSLIHSGIVTLAKTTLKSITGARIGVKFTYTNSVGLGEQTETQNWYSDYNNVAYTLYNKTQQKAITQFNVQYPTIVLLEEVGDNDELEVTATSKNASFMPVVGTATIENMQGTVILPIIELGGVDLSFKETDNSKVVAMLYDSNGQLVKKEQFVSSSLSLRQLADGEYTAVLMGESEFFNSFYSLKGLTEAGLVEGTDYVKKSLTISSGVVASLNLVVVPFFDESKLYYTGENTAFVVNKTKVVAGSYVTLQAKLDFKEAYLASVDNVELVFDLPQGTSFVPNSMMVGASMANYIEEGRQVTVALEDNYLNRVRFCVIPTESGNYAPIAYVRFSLDGKTVTQPIGSAEFAVEDINISVPTMTSRAIFSASGTAIGNSNVEIFDGNTLVGQTKSLANGMWVAECQLTNPLNLSKHSIMARVTTKEGLVMNTETQQMTYDENSIELSKVRMYHYNPEWRKNYEVVFDFKHPSTVAQKYTYYIFNKQFSFTIDFTDNDTTKINNVKLHVKTGNGQWTTLPATYDKKKNCWVANGEFGNLYDGNVPKNVAVSYDMKTPYVLDAITVADNTATEENTKDFIQTSLENGQDLIDQLIEAYTADNYDEQLVKEFEETIFSLYGLTEEEAVSITSEEEAQAFIAEIQKVLEDSIYHAADRLLEAETKELFKTADYAEGINITTCEGLSEANMEAEGYTKIAVNDSSFVYYLQTEDKVTIVNFTNNYRAEVSLGGNSSKAMLIPRAAANEDFLSQMNAFIASAQKKCNEISDKLNQVDNFITSFKVAADLGYLKAKSTFSKTLATLKEFSAMRRAGNIIPGHALIEGNLQYNAKYSGRLMLNAQSVGNKISNAKRSPLGLAAGKLKETFDIVTEILNAISYMKELSAIYQSVSPCPGDPEGAEQVKKLATVYGIGAITFYTWNIASSIIALNSAVASAEALIPTSGTSVLVLIGDLGLSIIKGKASEAFSKRLAINLQDLRALANQLNCKKKDENPASDHSHWIYSEEPDADVIIDPSGYVYEGVSSNRLQGVTATCYYKEVVADIYGDLHENIVLWDAAEYAQENPLFTDEMGMYRWDVPQGLWQVKFEKEGYQTTYSEWLPVPPPQLEVNIAMVQNVMPEVKAAKAYEEGVEIEFSKYMMPETLTPTNLYLKLITGETEEMVKDLNIELMNVEAVSENDATLYTSKVALKTEKNLGLADEVYVIVDKAVKSYAGIQMAESYNQKLDVEKKVRQIVADTTLNVGYDQKQTITVGALPNDASKGKVLMVKMASDMIATIEAENATTDEQGFLLLTLDENGQSSLTVNGEMLGTTALSFSIKNDNIAAQTIINVVEPAKLADVKAAVASRISGTAVYRGQTVALSCETEGATIYYTLDGSCPCDEATRQKYNGKPIVINGDMTLKVMAVGVNGSESEVKEYIYSIKQTQLQLNLSEGWNWSSHNQMNTVMATDLHQDYISRVLTLTSEIYNDPQLGFIGNMPDVDALTGIKLQTKAEGVMTFSGEQFNPNATAVELVEGWNWIGYPLDQTMTIAEALSKLEAEEGDCLTNLEGGYANYSEGTWTGTLNLMTPGQAYLYKSASNKSFLYNDAIVSNAKAIYSKRLETMQAPWTVNVHGYPDMMCLTAELVDNGVRTTADDYFVGAFVGDECRGIGKWVNGILYMAVYGGTVKGEQLLFRAVACDNGEEFMVKETMSFNADVIGSVTTPVTLHLGESTGISNTGADLRKTEGVYNMMGLQMKNVDREGVYIVNGQKVLINKRNMNEYVK